MGTTRRGLLFFCVFIFAVITGCSNPSNRADHFKTEDREPAAAVTRELPWELRGPHGETFLPNVYYSEAADNQQVMPLNMDGARLQIDRLIYPTIGNPNLFVKTDPAAQLVFALRLEPEFMSHLGLKADDQVGAGQSPELRANVQFEKGAPGNQLRFYLLGRNQRGKTEQWNPSALTGDGVYMIEPTKILMDRESQFMPEPFRARKTLRVYFDQAALSKVAAGFYDIRFEIMKDGKIFRLGTGKPIYEYQYNSVRVFDKGPDANGEAYTILNVTDSQVSVGTKFDDMTLNRFEQWVRHLQLAWNSNHKEVRRAAFITFNGDLHNGGSPFSLSSYTVAKTYNIEARRILNLLKDLPIPLFLTAGNHDGYASTGQVPSSIANHEGLRDKLGIDFRPPLKEVIEEEMPGNTSTWPDFSWSSYEDYLKNSEYGGWASNLIAGSHLRTIPSEKDLTAGVSWLDRAWRGGWKEVPISKRNWMLYDGFYQWQKTYGPLYYSWTFGKSHYVSLNTFELRQHRRTGWGMYTVNYGGWMSPVQMAWLDGELDRAQERNRDIVLLAHHDPRGGHNGKDYPYQFKQVNYQGMGQSFTNYVQGEMINPVICKHAPSWALNADKKLSCLHDGLQEWMRPDPMWDCRPQDRLPGDPQLRCDVNKLKGSSTPWYSGYALLARVTGQNRGNLRNHPNLRTLMFGHTHYNSLEVKMEGDEIVPGKLKLDAESKKRLAQAETNNPMRALSETAKTKEDAESMSLESAGTNVKLDDVSKDNEDFVLDLEKAGHDFERIIQGAGEPGKKRELLILRTTSVSDLTSQTHNGKSNMGYQILEVYAKKDARGYDLPQVNNITFYQNQGDGNFLYAGQPIEFKRDRKLDPKDPGNPINTRFPMK